MWVVDFALKHAGRVPAALEIGEPTNQAVLRMHRKYGHPNLAELKRMSMSGDLDAEPKEDRRALSITGVIECEACSAGTQKLKKLSRRKGHRSAAVMFDTIITDHAGPYPSQVGRYKYITVFVDSSPSRFCFVYTVKPRK